MHQPQNTPQLPATQPQPQFLPQQYVVPGMPMAAAVPPVAPNGRSAGFWVAVTAAIATAVILALLAGFFIGRDSRLSNADVEQRLREQQRVDQVAQAKAVNDTRTDLLRRQRQLVNRVSSKAEARGRREGRAVGRNEGFDEGQDSGFSQGEAAGRNQGIEEGRQSGFDQGVCAVDSFYC